MYYAKKNVNYMFAFYFRRTACLFHKGHFILLYIIFLFFFVSHIIGLGKKLARNPRDNDSAFCIRRIETKKKKKKMGEEKITYNHI